jgi:hypothetical protein
MAAETDRTGFDETTNYLSEALGRLVPQWLARRAIRVSVSTDRREYAPGDPVEMEIEFRNRLPVPVTIHTPRQRLWGWSVDGKLEASDERRYMSDQEASMTFRGRERKRVRRLWNGKVRRTGTPDTWEPLSPGAHEIRAFIALEKPRPEARTEIVVG